jgi:phage-related protein
MADGSIIIDTKIDSKELKGDLKELKVIMKKGMQELNKIATVTLGAIAGGITAIGVASQNFAKTTDRIDKMSQRLSLSREGFQKWDFVLSQAGVSIDSMQMSMKTLTQQMETGSKAFEQLGINARDSEGNFRNQEQVFMETVIALQQMEAGIEKSALAQKLFGRSGQELLPLLNTQSEAMVELMGDAERLGLVLSNETIDAGVILTDALDQLNRTVKSLGTEAMLPLINIANDIITSFLDWATEGDKLNKIIEDVTTAIVEIIDSGIIQILGGMALAFKGVTIAVTGLSTAMKLLASPTGALGLVVAGVALLVIKLNRLKKAKLTELEGQIGGLAKQFDIPIKQVDRLVKAFDLGFGTAGIRVSKLAKDFKLTESQVRKLLLATDKLNDTDRASLQNVEDKLKVTRELRGETESLVKVTEDIGSSSSASADEIAKMTDAEKELLALVEGLKARLKKADLGKTAEDAGEEINKGLERTLKESAHKPLSAIKDLTDSIGESIMSATSGRIGGSIKGFLDVIGNIAIGIAQFQGGDIQGGISSVAEGLGGALDLAIGFAEGFFQVIDALANFSTEEVLSGLEETIEGLKGFFLEGGELYNISNMFNFGIQMVDDLVAGLMSEKDAIFEEITNIIANVSQMFVDNKDIITDIVSFVSGISLIILENLPLLLVAGAEILGAVTQGMVENLDEIVEGIMGVIVSLVDIVSNNLGDFIVLAIQIILAIVKGLIANAPLLISAIMQIIPLISLAIVESLPEIVEAVAELIPLIILTLVASFPTLLLAFVEMFLTIIQTVAILLLQIPQLFIALFTGLVTGTQEGIANLVSTVTEAGKGVAEAFMAIGENSYLGFIEGMSAMEDAWSDIEGFFQDLIDDFKDFFGIHSPSKLFEDFGVNIIDGLINGLVDTAGGIWDAISGIFGDVIDNVSGALDIIGSGISSAVGAVGGSIGSTVSNVAGAVGNFLGFASGSAYIEQDQIAQIHKGERIIPATFNDSIMSGETMMLNSKAFSSIMNGLTGGMAMPSVSGLSSQPIINLVAKVDGSVQVDGREIGRIAFEHTDEFVGGSFGS